MGDPAGEEEGWVGVGEVGWGEGHGIAVDEVADMVEGHDDHDGSAQGVDGLKTWRRFGERHCSVFIIPRLFRAEEDDRRREWWWGQRLLRWEGCLW